MEERIIGYGNKQYRTRTSGSNSQKEKSKANFEESEEAKLTY